MMQQGKPLATGLCLELLHQDAKIFVGFCRLREFFLFLLIFVDVLVVQFQEWT